MSFPSIETRRVHCRQKEKAGAKTRRHKQGKAHLGICNDLLWLKPWVYEGDEGEEVTSGKVCWLRYTYQIYSAENTEKIPPPRKFCLLFIFHHKHLDCSSSLANHAESWRQNWICGWKTKFWKLKLFLVWILSSGVSNNLQPSYCDQKRDPEKCQGGKVHGNELCLYIIIN